MIHPEWKTVNDTECTHIPLFENMIQDIMHQNPTAKYIFGFTNDYVLVKMDDTSKDI